MASIELTFKERKEIERLASQGMSAHQISLTLGRGKTTVYQEFNRNGGRESYNAINAQKNKKERRKEGIIKIKNILKGKPPDFFITMKERLEALEMQVEILSDTIKELINDKNTKNNRL